METANLLLAILGSVVAVLAAVITGTWVLRSMLSSIDNRLGTHVAVTAVRLDGHDADIIELKKRSPRRR